MAVIPHVVNSKNVPCIRVSDSDHVVAPEKLFSRDLQGQLIRVTVFRSMMTTFKIWSAAKTAMLPRPSKKLTVS